MAVEPYNRQAVLAYAKQWAMKRNPAYFNFDALGGDCTNFASQCIYAGSGVMNYRKIFGWYYSNSDNRTPSWTGVPYLYNFLITNNGPGPFAREISQNNVRPGDIVQLGTYDNNFYHSPVVVGIDNGSILVAAHSDDAYMRPLETYVFDRVRFLQIQGVRK